jgi:hypothetical protein
VKPVEGRKVELLDVVKQLCLFVAQLPAYVLNTRKLPLIALAVRDTILNAREPAALLFSDLPKACGFGPIAARATETTPSLLFAKTLKSALDDLRVAYPELHERLRVRLRSAFDLPGSFQQFRSTLAERAEQILVGIAEPKLRAFCLRLIDDKLSESEWIESIGSFLAVKPPAKWHDAEEDLFNRDLSVWARRFHHIETIVFAAGGSSRNSVGVRVAITQANGIELEQVLHYALEEEDRLKELQQRFEGLLAKEGRLGLAAVSRAILISLEKRSTATYG